KSSDCAPAYECQGGACVHTKPTCDGDHTLTKSDGSTINCAPYGCEGSACRTECNSSLECAKGAVCNRNHGCIDASNAQSADNTGCAITQRSFSTTGAWEISLLIFAGLLRRRRAA